MTVYDYREITLKDDLCLEISRDTDIENPRENDCNAATFYCLKSPRRKIGDIIDSAFTPVMMIWRLTSLLPSLLTVFVLTGMNQNASFGSMKM